MDSEAFLFALILGTALLPFAWRLQRSGARLMALFAFGLWVAVAVSASRTARLNRPEVIAEADIKHRPIAVPSKGYVSSDTCRSCHPKEYHSWHGSYHRTMTQVASPGAIKGDFDNVEVNVLGRVFKLEREEDEFFAEMDLFEKWIPGSEPAPRVRKKIELVTGSHHMQVYWYSEGRGRKLMQLPIIYNFEVNRWVPRDSMFLRPVAEFNNEEGRWNITCIKCHTTRGEQHVASMSDMDSKVAEFGIACEECHGPGEEHVRLNRDPRRRYELRRDEGADHSIMLPTHLSGKRQSQVCGQCHGIYFDQEQDVHNRYEPGADIHAVRELVQLGKDPEREREMAEQMGPTYLPGLFWSDGRVRVSGREYNGLVESPCFTHGDEKRGVMSCLSCHNSHHDSSDGSSLKQWADDQLKPGMQTNKACTQCHEEFADETKLATHTHHQADSSGSHCFNCHMPHTTYGLVKALRSHTISSPDIKTDLQTGRPNACTQCHIDQTAAWAGGKLKEWYGHDEPDYTEDEREVAHMVWLALRGDAGQRALAAWSLGWEDALETTGKDWQAPVVGQMLNDRYLAVRFVAQRSLKRLKGFDDFDYDFLGTDEDCHGAVKRIHRRWSKQKRTRVDANLLIEEGGLDRTRFNSMLARRFDPDMMLLE